MSIIVIDRDFLNHDQTGSCESIVFIKGRKEEWKGMQIRFFASTILYRRLFIQVLSLKRTFSLVPYVCLYLERGTEKRTTTTPTTTTTTPQMNICDNICDDDDLVIYYYTYM